MPHLRSAEAGERLGTLYRQQICAIFFLFSALGAEHIQIFVRESSESMRICREYVLVSDPLNHTHTHTQLFSEQVDIVL